MRQLCHELRNPLASIQGNIELMQDSLDDVLVRLMRYMQQNEHNNKLEDQYCFSSLKRLNNSIQEVKSYARAIDVATEQQTIIVNDTLTLSRLENIQNKEERVPIDLSDLLSKLIDMHSRIIAQKGVVIEAVIDDKAHFIGAEAKGLKQILINLISNAIKFTDNGRIDIEIEVIKEGEDYLDLAITVRDTGIGMEPSQIPSK